MAFGHHVGSANAVPTVDKYCRQRPLQAARYLWNIHRLPRNWSIPEWFCHLQGVHPSMLRKVPSKLTEMEQMSCFLVRMRYLIQTDFLRKKILLPTFVEKFVRFTGRTYKECFVSPHTRKNWSAHVGLKTLRGVLSSTCRAFYHSCVGRFDDPRYHLF